MGNVAPAAVEVVEANGGLRGVASDAEKVLLRGSVSRQLARPYGKSSQVKEVVERHGIDQDPVFSPRTAAFKSEGLLAMAVKSKRDALVADLLPLMSVREIGRQDSLGRNALHAACTTAGNCCLPLLLASGKIVDDVLPARDTTALHVLAYTRDLEHMLPLIRVASAATLALRDSKGQTALVALLRPGRGEDREPDVLVECVREMVGRMEGITVAFMDLKERTALYLAMAHALPRCAAILGRSQYTVYRNLHWREAILAIGMFAQAGEAEGRHVVECLAMAAEVGPDVCIRHSDAAGCTFLDAVCSRPCVEVLPQVMQRLPELSSYILAKSSLALLRLCSNRSATHPALSALLAFLPSAVCTKQVTAKTAILSLAVANRAFTVDMILDLLDFVEDPVLLLAPAERSFLFTLFNERHTDFAEEDVLPVVDVWVERVHKQSMYCCTYSPVLAAIERGYALCLELLLAAEPLAALPASQISPLETVAKCPAEAAGAIMKLLLPLQTPESFLAGSANRKPWLQLVCGSPAALSLPLWISDVPVEVLVDAETSFARSPFRALILNRAAEAETLEAYLRRLPAEIRLRMARRKAYPLALGATLAHCGPDIMAVLLRYASEEGVAQVCIKQRTCLHAFALSFPPNAPLAAEKAQVLMSLLPREVIGMRDYEGKLAADIARGRLPEQVVAILESSRCKGAH